MAISTPLDDALHLTIPLRSEYGASLRPVAAAFGADAAFSLEDIDDLRLAVSEVFSSALQRHGSRAALTAVFTNAAPGMQVGLLVLAEDGSPGVIELDDLAFSIIQAATDHVEVEEFSVRLFKHCSEIVGNHRR